MLFSLSCVCVCVCVCGVLCMLACVWVGTCAHGHLRWVSGVIFHTHPVSSLRYCQTQSSLTQRLLPASLLWGNPLCTGYFSIAVMKHHCRGNLQKIWANSPRGLEFMLVKSRFGNRNRKLVACKLNSKQAGNEQFKLENLKARPQ